MARTGIARLHSREKNVRNSEPSVLFDKDLLGDGSALYARQHKRMEHSTAIKSIQDGTTLEFSDRAGEYYRVSLHGPDFRGACRVYAFEPASHLSGFFRDLAADWRGWQGTKEWASLEGELRFSATCDSTGHISLSVRLRSGHSVRAIGGRAR